MNISIKSSQAQPIPGSSTLGKTGIDRSPERESEAKSFAAGSRETVSISGSAKALYAQNTAVERQSLMSPSELKGLYHKTELDIVSFSHRIGSRSFDRDSLLPDTNDAARLEMGRKALDFAVSLHQSPPGRATNPFASMNRKDLSGMVYDDSVSFTMAERYAASVELRKQDSDHFAMLTAKLKLGGDNQQVFKGILEYFDDLAPVEKAAYPDSFRESIEKLAARTETPIEFNQ